MTDYLVAGDQTWADVTTEVTEDLGIDEWDDNIKCTVNNSLTIDGRRTLRINGVNRGAWSGSGVPSDRGEVSFINSTVHLHEEEFRIVAWSMSLDNSSLTLTGARPGTNNNAKMIPGTIINSTIKSFFTDAEVVDIQYRTGVSVSNSSLWNVQIQVDVDAELKGLQMDGGFPTAGIKSSNNANINVTIKDCFVTDASSSDWGLLFDWRSDQYCKIFNSKDKRGNIGVDFYNSMFFVGYKPINSTFQFWSRWFIALASKQAHDGETITIWDNSSTVVDRQAINVDDNKFPVQEAEVFRITMNSSIAVNIPNPTAIATTIGTYSTLSSKNGTHTDIATEAAGTATGFKYLVDGYGVIPFMSEDYWIDCVNGAGEIGSESIYDTKVLLIDNAITNTTKATVLAYTTIDDFSELYDSLTAYCVDNPVKSRAGNRLAVEAGGIIDIGTLDIDINSAATNAITIETTKLIAKPIVTVEATQELHTLKTTGDITFITASIGSGSIFTGNVYLNIEQNLTNVTINGDLHINTGIDSALVFTNVVVSGNVYNDDTLRNLIINANGGSLTPGDIGTGNGETDIQNVVTVKIICKDTSGDPIEGAMVYVNEGTNNIITSLTDINGVAENITYNYSTDKALTGWARKGTSPPYFTQTSIIGTVISSGFELTITMSND